MHAGFHVPKGQWMMVPIYAIHRDVHTWGPDADQFRPERWLRASQQDLDVQRRCFMPFGDGGRHCPGSRFALQEVKITLFRLLRDFSLELAAPQVMHCAISCLLQLEAISLCLLGNERMLLVCRSR